MTEAEFHRAIMQLEVERREIRELQDRIDRLEGELQRLKAECVFGDRWLQFQGEMQTLRSEVKTLKRE